MGHYLSLLHGIQSAQECTGHLRIILIKDTGRQIRRQAGLHQRGKEDDANHRCQQQTEQQQRPAEIHPDLPLHDGDDEHPDGFVSWKHNRLEFMALE